MNISVAVRDPAASFLTCLLTLCCLRRLKSQQICQHGGREGRAARGARGGSTARALPKIRPSPCTRTSPPAPACVPVPGWLSAGESFVRFTLLLLHCFIYVYLNLCLSSLPSPPPLHPLFSLVSCFLRSQIGDWAMPGCAGPGMVLGGQWKGPGDPWPTPARATAFCLLA